jgi:hypothetical protein
MICYISESNKQSIAENARSHNSGLGWGEFAAGPGRTALPLCRKLDDKTCAATEAGADSQNLASMEFDYAFGNR